MQIRHENGKKTVVMSKQDWTTIGKKQNWISKADKVVVSQTEQNQEVHRAIDFITEQLQGMVQSERSKATIKEILEKAKNQIINVFTIERGH